jgi:uncharacterized protein (DUF1684 family)
MADVVEEGSIRSLEEWRASMDASIRKENNWLALAGLFWLRQGDNSFGSAQSNDIVLPPPCPPHAGSFLLEDRTVRLQVANRELFRIEGRVAADGALEADVSDDPTRLSLGPLSMVMIQRDRRVGLRLWDNSRRIRETYPGRTWFPGDLAWRLDAAFKPYDPPRPISVLSVLGDPTDEAAVGRVEFTLRGQPCRLEALQTESGGLWLIFGDATNGSETYPSGRFLVCPAPDGGRAVVDFNRAYNPPCAFTRFATCPLPPPENVLELRIEAGERDRLLADSAA